MAGEYEGAAVAGRMTAAEDVEGLRRKCNLQGVAALCSWYVPLGALQADLIPSHRLQVGATRARPDRQSKEVAKHFLRLLVQRLKESRQFVRSKKSLAALFTKLLDAVRWIPPGPSQIASRLIEEMM